MLAWFNNRLINEESISIPLQDLGLLRGFAIFDYFRTANYRSLFREWHIERFYRSAQALQFSPLPSAERLTAMTDELIIKNKLSESGIRILLTGGISVDGYTRSVPNLIITQQPLKMPDADAYEKGINIITHQYTRPFPEIKTTSYIMGVLLQEKLLEEGASDVLYHEHGLVTEFPRCNCFIVTHDNKIITPGRNILKGITRMQVLKIAAAGYDTVEGDLQLTELLQAKEVFLTATSKRIMPVTRINGKAVGDGKPGQVTIRLLNQFLEIENSQAGLKSPQALSNTPVS